MAFVDWNGNITIDEAAAEADIRKAEMAVSILRETESALKALAVEAGDFQGDTASAIGDKSQELLVKLQKLISNLESMQSYTRQVVARYRKLDQEIKELFEKNSKM